MTNENYTCSACKCDCHCQEGECPTCANDVCLECKCEKSDALKSE